MFNENDVRLVASELVENAIYWDNGYENAMNPHDGYCSSTVVLVNMKDVLSLNMM